MANLAFIGLGVMGAPMAGHLVAAGHQMRVWNRSKDKVERWASHHKGKIAETPADAARGADVVFACVGDDAALDAVTRGAEGIFEAMGKGAIFVDHSSVSVAITQEIASDASKKGLGYVDAPVSGGQSGAENGNLAIMCGGEADHFDRIEAIIAAYAGIARHVGPVGSGQGAKLVNQIAIAGLLQGLSEALTLCSASGLNAEAVLEVITGGAAGSWQMQNRSKTMLSDEFDFGFAVDWMRKDLKNCLAEAERLGVSLPVTALVDQFYLELQKAGGGRLDTSSLIRRLKN